MAVMSPLNSDIMSGSLDIPDPLVPFTWVSLRKLPPMLMLSSVLMMVLVSTYNRNVCSITKSIYSFDVSSRNANNV